MSTLFKVADHQTELHWTLLFSPQTLCQEVSMNVLHNKHRILFLLIFSIVLAFVLPATALGQGRGRGRGEEKKFYKFVNGHDARDGRWDGRGRRIAQSYVIYQQRPAYSYRTYTYGYPQTNYGSQYYTYGSSQPYYTNQYYSYGYSQPYRYYSYRYSQPYFANRYAYSWANPTYRYDAYRYRQRYRGDGLRIGIRLR